MPYGHRPRRSSPRIPRAPCASPTRCPRRRRASPPRDPARRRESALKTLAILLDTRPRYLHGLRGPASVLLTPLGSATVLSYLARRLAALGHARLTIATDFGPE